MIPLVPMIKQLFKQFIARPFTNLFPSDRVPSSVTEFLESGEPNPPVPVPPDFRGKLKYEKDKCIGCYACIRVCPANVIKPQMEGDQRKIRMELSRCTFCGQCVDVCPVNCLHLTDEFLLADYDKDSDNLTIE